MLLGVLELLYWSLGDPRVLWVARRSMSVLRFVPRFGDILALRVNASHPGDKVRTVSFGGEDPGIGIVLLFAALRKTGSLPLLRILATASSGGERPDASFSPTPPD
jgi:hypothetical protein